ncbi:hypothetical protein [Neosynechococcus sphagnicola]|uniref:hypothetical protein n=1 Tax=Neosynechococcus sphagnicola TaxID=1501145 RepID=UPI001955277E|nr:hypothetical protein [Neosynechococcus sphagnicola]
MNAFALALLCSGTMLLPVSAQTLPPGSRYEQLTPFPQPSLQPAATPLNQPPQHHKPTLNLSSDQKAKMQQIRQRSLAQITALLNPSQQQQMQTAIQQGQKPHQALKSLNLTSDQKARVKQIRKETKQQIQALLTPEQLQQMQQQHQARRNHQN